MSRLRDIEARRAQLLREADLTRASMRLTMRVAATRMRSWVGPAAAGLAAGQVLAAGSRLWRLVGAAGTAFALWRSRRRPRA